MNNRSLIYMTGAVLVAIGFLFAFNLTSIFWNPYPQTYISHNEVSGSAVEYDAKLYTLNFEQQNELIDLLNRLLVVKKGHLGQDKQKPDFKRLIIYRFDKPDLIITPIAIEDDNYLFAIPEWNNDMLFRDISRGTLKNLLSQTYDRK